MSKTKPILFIILPYFLRSLSFFKKIVLQGALFMICCFSFRNLNGQTSKLFNSEEILELTLRGDLRSLFRDRGDDPQYHPATIVCDADKNELNIPVKIKTRGNFRKSHYRCDYPPILLNFKKSTIPETSIFSGQDKVKLVTPCEGEQFVIHEYLVYKMYNLLTPKSFNVRLVKLVFQDTVRNKTSNPKYGILLESEEEVCFRNKLYPVEESEVLPEKTNKDDFLLMAVFQFMIGNTDWSVKHMQNIKLYATDSTDSPSVIPYDFDHAGIVRAPYAKPIEALEMNSTLERRYRGYCIRDINQYSEIFEIFNSNRENIYALYRDNLLLTNRYKKQTLKYLDQFYEIINDTKKAREEFWYPCEETKRVEIRGL